MAFLRVTYKIITWHHATNVLEFTPTLSYNEYSGVRLLTSGSPLRDAGSNCKNVLLKVSSTSVIAAWFPQLEG